MGALVSALCMALGLVTAPPAVAAAPAVPNLTWQPCAAEFLCATATVPLDYANPRGATIRLAVIKHPATDPAHRIGSVFFNPGGPGGSGVDILPPLYSRFPATVRARFDVVSFDPRGIGQSAVLRCFDTIGQEQQFLAGLPAGYPIGHAQQQLWEDTYARFDQTCAAHAGPLLAHDTTADTARDMDLLRQAVGDPALNYLGGSYGTYIGATYANLFPTKVRAITLDGNVDPVRWAASAEGVGPALGTFLRLGSDQGSAVALNGFLDLCGKATVTSCAFTAGSPAATHAKFDTLLDRLASTPVGLAGFTFTKALTVGVVINLLYDVQPLPNLSSGWPGAATILENLWLRTSGGAAPATPALTAEDLAVPGLGVPANADAPYVGRESELGVLCSDDPNPRVPSRYPAQAAYASARSGAVGPYWTWIAEACAQWPVLAPQRYTGPWNRPTARPILVVGNTGDPATPYQDAVAMSHDLADARLVTVDGYGHTALGNHSGCVDMVESRYFVTGALPPPGTVCRPDQAPFTVGN
ncbi:MAG TPA: alpha/beta hydrolase [Pseudonocardiaceae bacterium]|nr:alpha/beta hydrolase [Pseudonocardiaceae bacterium]